MAQRRVESSVGSRKVNESRTTVWDIGAAECIRHGIETRQTWLWTCNQSVQRYVAVVSAGVAVYGLRVPHERVTLGT